jgi:nicotinamide-nucleotide amidase
MRAEIVSVGTEMLLGMIADTNAQYLAQQLADLGIDVFWVSQIGDNLGRVVEVFQRARSRSDVVIVTGGLGPTEDDLTREAIAATFGEEMKVDPELEQYLRDNFARRGRPMPERNIKQATLIPSAQSIPNPVGTAPGWWVERDGVIIAAMPGVPSEMKLMWEHEVRPRLHGRSGSVLLTTNLKVLGLGEGQVEEQLGDLIHGSNPTVATYAKPDGVYVRVTAKAPDDAAAEALLTPTVEAVSDVLGGYVYGRDADTLAAIAAKLLGERGWTLASAEIGTAGALAGEVVADQALAERFLGGQVLTAAGLGRNGERADPAALAGLARTASGADVGIAAVLDTTGERPDAQYAVAIQDTVQTNGTRWNLTIPELRRRAAIETLALLVNTLRETR